MRNIFAIPSEDVTPWGILLDISNLPRRKDISEKIDAGLMPKIYLTNIDMHSELSSEDRALFIKELKIYHLNFWNLHHKTLRPKIVYDNISSFLTKYEDFNTSRSFSQLIAEQVYLSFRNCFEMFYRTNHVMRQEEHYDKTLEQKSEDEKLKLDKMQETIEDLARTVTQKDSGHQEFKKETEVILKYFSENIHEYMRENGSYWRDMFELKIEVVLSDLRNYELELLLRGED